jgi:hypothetical protein
MWRLFGSGIWDPSELDQESLQHEMSCSALRINETVEERKERAFKWFNFDGVGPSQIALTSFLAEATEKGIPVMFVSIPITKRGRDGLPVPIDDPSYQVLSPVVSFPDEQFCDVVHMNPVGRKRYAAWLSDKISSQLLTGDSHVQ